MLSLRSGEETLRLQRIERLEKVEQRTSSRLQALAEHQKLKAQEAIQKAIRAEQNRRTKEAENSHLTAQRDTNYQRKMQGLLQLKNLKNDIEETSYNESFLQDNFDCDSQLLYCKDDFTEESGLASLNEKLKLSEFKWKNQLINRAETARSHLLKVEAVKQSSRLAALELEEKSLMRAVEKKQDLQNKLFKRAKSASERSKAVGEYLKTEKARHAQAMTVVKARIHQEEIKLEAKDLRRSKSIERTKEAITVHREQLASASARKAGRQSANYIQQKAQEMKRKLMILQQERERDEVAQMLNKAKEEASRNSLERCHLLNMMRGQLRAPVSHQ